MTPRDLAAPSVSLSQSLGSETVRHSAQLHPSNEPRSETRGETLSIKALAERWFLRNAPRDTNETDDRAGVSRRVRQSATGKTLPSADNLTERASVIEEGANVSRTWAEAFARLELSGRGDLDTAGRALDRWAVKADAMGWRPHELLAVALQGEVLALTAEGVTLRTDETVRHIRRPCHDEA